MVTTLKIDGMTCTGCVGFVKKTLEAQKGVADVLVNLTPGQAFIQSEKPLSITVLAEALGAKYSISESAQGVFEASSKGKNAVGKTLKGMAIMESIDAPSILDSEAGLTSAFQSQNPWKQLRPLFLIFCFIIGGVLLTHWEALLNESLNEVVSEIMLDFMAMFFMVFSFFKLLDLKGFPASFSMYDPLAKKWAFYAKIYPFIELGLGILLLLRIFVPVALVITLVILGLTTTGVVQSLLSKRKIQCACLGTALKLPMTQATFIENTIMILMALWMLF